MEPQIHVGVDARTGKPVLVPLSVFERHTWVMGMSGAMKSVQAASLIVRLMEADPGACFVLPDAGGDQYTFHRTKNAAARLWKVFRFLSLGPDDDWSALDPMEAVTPLSEPMVPKATSYYVSALSLDHGGGFGKSYYGLQNFRDVANVFAELLMEGNLTPTFRDFVKKIAERGKKRRTSDLTEAQLAAEGLLYYPQLEPSEFADRSISVSRAIEEGHVIYGFLPTLMEPGSRSIAGLLVWSFVLEAMRRMAAGLPKRHIYLVCDEFASLASAKAFADLVSLARKYGIRLILINQDSSQLMGSDRDLRPLLNTNTALKLWLTPLAEDFEYLQALSPDVLKSKGSSKHYGKLSGTVSKTESFEPDLERNLGLDVTFERFEGFAVINDFNGYKPPVHYHFTPDLTKEEHAELANKPLPQRIRIDIDTQGGGNKPEDSAEAAKRLTKLDILMAKKVADEAWLGAV